MSMMNDFEEDLEHFPAENRENRPNHWLEYIAKKQEVESQLRFHLFLMDQRIF